MKKRLLFVNPWIYDFAAYDLWMKPLALLYLISIFKRLGFKTDFIDCLEGVENAVNNMRETVYGCRRFIKETVPKPQILKNIPRTYSKYGITFENFKSRLENIEKPDVILVGSMMTYWYEGVFAAIKILKKFFPEALIILGGKYTEICPKHAVEKSGADYVIKTGDIKSNVNEITKYLNTDVNWDEGFDSEKFPFPAFEQYVNPRYACLITSIGCPFKCTYCYTPISGQQFKRRSNENILNELSYWYERNIRNIAFYDDALNYKAELRLKPVLKRIIEKPFNFHFHTPNAISAGWIDDELANLMKHSGFKTLRLGFETEEDSRQKEMGGKIYLNNFLKGVKSLKNAGFDFNELGAYILTGTPGQKPAEVIKSIDYLLDLGVRPYIAEYTPIPGTKMFEESKEFSNLDFENEPLLQNNSFLPLSNKNFTYGDLNSIKEYLKGEISKISTL